MLKRGTSSPTTALEEGVKYSSRARSEPHFPPILEGRQMLKRKSKRAHDPPGPLRVSENSETDRQAETDSRGSVQHSLQQSGMVNLPLCTSLSKATTADKPGSGLFLRHKQPFPPRGRLSSNGSPCHSCLLTDSFS